MEAMREWADTEEQASAAPEAPSYLVTAAGRAKMLVAVFVMALLGLTLFQFGKVAVVPGLKLWQSHVITVAFGAFAATVAAYLILHRYEQLYSDRELTRQVVEQIGFHLRSQLERQKELQTIINRSSTVAFLERAAPGWPVEFVSANVEQFGYPAQDFFSGRIHIHDLVHPEDREKACLDEAGKCSSRQDERRREYRMVTKSGDVRCVEEQSWARLDRTGAVTHRQGIIIDITERRQAEEAIRTLSRAIEQGPASVVITDSEGRIEYVNSKFSQVTGYSLEEALGQNPRILKSGETPPETYRQLWETITAGGEWRGEFHNKKKSGELYWEMASISGIKNPEGVVTHYVGVKEDITERKRMEHALRESEQKIRALFDHTFQFIGLMKPDGTLIEANKTALDFCGVQRSDVIEKPFWETPWWTHSQEMVDKIRDGTRRAANGGLVRFEATHTSADGSLHYVDFSLTPVKDKAGNVVLLIPEGRDITERKQAEEALARDHEITEAMDDLKSALLASSTVEEISSRVLKYAQHLTDSKIGFVGYIAPDTGYLVATTMSEHIWDACRVEGKELIFTHLSGMLGWVLDNKKPLLTNSPTLDERSVGIPEGHMPIERFLGAPALLGDELVGMVALANPGRDYRDDDLSTAERLAGFYALALQHKRSEEALAKDAEELARSNADLQQFAYIASHDLQEPLRMISSYVQLLARRYQGKLDKEADEFIGFAIDGANRMQQLISGLLDYSRVGTRGEEFEPVDCESVFDEAVANLEIAIKESGAIVTHDPLPTVSADRMQLVQLLQNFIGNGIKFRGEEPPRIRVSAENAAGEWRFSVTDNGVGIAPEDRERVFKIFERLRTQENQPGTGMGLAICKRIVERHGGRTWVESEPGKGSTFYFTIPNRAS